MAQNVTISLPDDLVRQVRHLAVDRGVSLSRFVSMVLEEQLDTTRRYHAARERQRRLIASGLPLGTNGVVRWTRDELHER